MHLVHVIKDIDVASGGPSRSLSILVDGLSKRGVHNTVLYGSSVNQKIDIDSEDLVGLGRITNRNVRLNLRGIHSKTPISLIHSHGCWAFLNSYALRHAANHEIPSIVSPRGMLEPWSLNQKWFRKRLAWAIYQKRDVKSCRIVHATSDKERSGLLNIGVQNDIRVIPNGIESPPNQIGDHPEPGKKTMLCLSRIHPVKGLLMLVRAWAIVRPTGWCCRIVGPNEGNYADVVNNEIRKLNVHETISIEPPVYGADRWAEYRKASLFVLPSFTENFGNSIAEALACGLPVITTKGTPWQELPSEGCGWWTDVNEASIADAIKSATSRSIEELNQMGDVGTRLFERRYKLSRVIDSMLEMYVKASSPKS